MLKNLGLKREERDHSEDLDVDGSIKKVGLG
jgi:hypothetical protein